MGSLGLNISNDNASLPLSLTVNRAGVGGITGLTPTVAVRDGSTLNSYLDFFDDTFKTSGWTTKYATMTHIERGHYQYSLDVSALSLSANDALVAEYHVDNGGDVVGDASDLFVVAEFESDLRIVRQSVTNRMETVPGDPGLLILYDDTGVTEIARWELRDTVGGAILAVSGTPAKRSNKIP